MVLLYCAIRPAGFVHFLYFLFVALSVFVIFSQDGVGKIAGGAGGLVFLVLVVRRARSGVRCDRFRCGDVKRVRPQVPVVVGN